MKNNQVIQPEGNYYDKYHTKNPIAKWMMSNYFKNLDILLDDIHSITSILEAGCGEGEVTNYIAKRYSNENCSIEAFDISEKVISEAKKNTSPRINFFTGDIYDMPSEKKYDLILCCEVLEHLDAPEKALQTLKHLAQNYILLSVPREPIWCLLNMARGKYLPALGNTPGHVQHWNTNKFIRFLKENGLHVVRVTKPLPWTMVLCKVK